MDVTIPIGTPEGLRAASLILKYIENILGAPDVAKFRRIPKTNDRFVTKVASVSGTMEFFLSMGFKEEGQMLVWRGEADQLNVLRKHYEALTSAISREQSREGEVAADNAVESSEDANPVIEEIRKKLADPTAGCQRLFDFVCAHNGSDETIAMDGSDTLDGLELIQADTDDGRGALVALNGILVDYLFDDNTLRSTPLPVGSGAFKNVRRYFPGWKEFFQHAGFVFKDGDGAVFYGADTIDPLRLASRSVALSLEFGTIVEARRQNAALGAVMGALVGDATGAVLEFLGKQPSWPQVNAALAMPGGGAHKVAPGQITDDGELTISLASSLAQHSTWDLNDIAKQYVRWYNSDPFDVGHTTANALAQGKDAADTDVAAAVTEGAKDGKNSKANGSLMRASPLGVWGYHLTADELATCSMQDSALTHANHAVGQAVTCYTLAIAHLVAHPGDSLGAFQRAKQWCTAHAIDEVKTWMTEAEEATPVPYGPQSKMGFIRIAFTHAFRHLIAGTTYVAAIKETLRGGGDTDTNACIVGGLVGAARGVTDIPPAMIRALIQCDTETGRARPEFLHAKTAVDLVMRMLKQAPESLHHEPQTHSSNVKKAKTS